MDEYAKTWQDFVSGGRLEHGGHRDPSWSNGHEFSASLLVPIRVEPLLERLEPLREGLAPFPFVSLHPDHFLHITLLMLGFLVEEPREVSEISRRGLEEVEEAARRTLRDIAPFTVRLANLNAFPGAAFVEVHDGGELRALRSALCAGCGLREPPGPPHLTLAYFQAPEEPPVPDALVETIRDFRDWPVGELRVEAVQMTLLDLRPEYPELETVARLPLLGARGGSAAPQDAPTGRRRSAGGLWE